jgi:hypothetical protein
VKCKKKWIFIQFNRRKSTYICECIVKEGTFWLDFQLNGNSLGFARNAKSAARFELHNGKTDADKYRLCI